MSQTPLVHARVWMLVLEGDRELAAGARARGLSVRRPAAQRALPAQAAAWAARGAARRP